MNDREKLRERVRDIRASGTTWWWWWWLVSLNRFLSDLISLLSSLILFSLRFKLWFFLWCWDSMKPNLSVAIRTIIVVINFNRISNSHFAATYNISTMLLSSSCHSFLLLAGGNFILFRDAIPDNWAIFAWRFRAMWPRSSSVLPGLPPAYCVCSSYSWHFIYICIYSYTDHYYHQVAPTAQSSLTLSCHSFYHPSLWLVLQTAFSVHTELIYIYIYICNIMAEGFRFMPLGLVRLRTFRLSTWVS